MDRRSFLKTSASAAVITAFGGIPLKAMSAGDTFTLTILHTNDTHSRIEPFPMDGSRYEGMAGVEPRSRLIDKIRSEVEHVLLVDGGDVFQGTPYFNLFEGELEFKLMNKLGYEASVPGNHDFDKGIQNLADQLQKATFPMVISNYDISNTPLYGLTPPRHIIQKGPFKIGLVGSGLHLDGYVTPTMYGDIRFLDTVTEIEKHASILKHDEKCDLVICLSHLGYQYSTDKISDVVLAAATSSVDIIIGGHTHTFLKEPTIIQNKVNKPVIVNQAGWAGIQLGRLDIHFERNFKNKCITCKNEWVI